MITPGSTQFRSTRTVLVPYATDRFFLKSTEVELGYLIYAFDTAVLYSIIDTDQLDNSSGYLNLSSGGGGGGGSSGYNASTNASGNTTITVDADSSSFVEKTTVSGSAGTRIFVIDTADASAGEILSHRIIAPTTASIVLEWRNETSGGTLLQTFTTDTSGDALVCDFVYTGSAWEFLNSTIPSNPGS